MKKTMAAFAGLLLAATTLGMTNPANAAGPAAAPTAEQLLGKVKNCAKQISNGTYSSDNGRGKYRFEANGRAALAGIRVCEKSGAVYFKADMDIDCDGQQTTHCNKANDPYFQPETACTQSNGRYLISEKLPFVVVPLKSSIWDPARSGLKCGTVGVVIYNGKMVYAVVGDQGPKTIIGEASYAAAKALGINPHPTNGGIGSGVTYILFKNQQVSPLESHTKAVEVGKAQAEKFLSAS